MTDGAAPPAAVDVIGSRMSAADVIREATAALASRPSRAALTALGTVLGVAALVATLGIAKTAGSQIISTFDELEATEVVATSRHSGGFDDGRALVRLPWDAEERATRLNGVVSAGTLSTVDVAGAAARSVPVIDPLGQQEFQVPVMAGSPGLLAALRGRLATGRFFDAGHSGRRDRVAVLGPAAARRLGIAGVTSLPAIFVGDTALAVIGVLADDGVQRQPAVLSAILVPDRTAAELWGLGSPEALHLDTEIGAAEQVATEIRVALSPDDPDLVEVGVAAAPVAVKAQVEDDVNALFLALGGLSLLVGALGIANVTLVSVLERRGEIGLRRAVGAARRHIAAQFLAESTGLGALGGVFGTSAGILVVVAVAAARDWTPVMDGWLPAVAPVLGAAVGLVAGIYPAWRAASTEPIAALRSTN